MRIAILVRHGESESNVRNLITSDYDGYPLTRTGKSQVEKTAEQLRGIKIGSFFTSPVQRARETAEILSNSVRLSPVLDDRIRESGMGEYNNHLMHEIPRLKRSELGMESWESHQDRFEYALKDVKGVGLLVSHAFPIRAALAFHLGLNEEESYGINIRNASISVIDIDRSEVLCVGSRYLSDRVKNYLGEAIA